jgi:predicted amidophosphoribosyltransferase
MATRPKTAERPPKPLSAEIFLQPWFVSAEIAKSIRRLLPVIHFHKMRFYFDDWGCMRCGKKNVMYGANGMCRRCAQKIQHRVVSCLQKRHDGEAPRPNRKPGVCSRVESAKVLLSDLVQHQSQQRSGKAACKMKR